MPDTLQARPITAVDACDRAVVVIRRDSRPPITGRLFWVHPSGHRAKVILSSGAVINVRADQCERAG